MFKQRTPKQIYTPRKMTWKKQTVMILHTRTHIYTLFTTSRTWHGRIPDTAARERADSRVVHRMGMQRGPCEATPVAHIDGVVSPVGDRERRMRRCRRCTHGWMRGVDVEDVDVEVQPPTTCTCIARDGCGRFRCRYGVERGGFRVTVAVLRCVGPTRNKSIADGLQWRTTADEMGRYGWTGRGRGRRGSKASHGVG